MKSHMKQHFALSKHARHHYLYISNFKITFTALNFPPWPIAGVLKSIYFPMHSIQEATSTESLPTYIFLMQDGTIGECEVSFDKMKGQKSDGVAWHYITAFVFALWQNLHWRRFRLLTWIDFLKDQIIKHFSHIVRYKGEFARVKTCTECCQKPTVGLISLDFGVELENKSAMSIYLEQWSLIQNDFLTSYPKVAFGRQALHEAGHFKSHRSIKMNNSLNINARIH